MQSYRTCHAAQITHVAVGQSTLPSVNAPANNVGSQRQQEDAAAVASRRGYVVAPGPATPESAVAFQANDRGSINPNLTAEHDARLKAITADTTLNDAQRASAVADENKAYSEATQGLGVDENDDGIDDNLQDIIHLTLTGGEKRSILRSDMSFAPTVIDRRNADFPPYARRAPIAPDNNGIVDQNSLNSPNTVGVPARQTFVEPNGLGTGQYSTSDQRAADVARRDGDVNQDAYPRVGDWLVEDWDVFTDKWIQKVYDNVTFGRYFKASLN